MLTIWCNQMVRDHKKVGNPCSNGTIMVVQQTCLSIVQMVFGSDPTIAPFVLVVMVALFMGPVFNFFKSF